jgi:hypothetical protein
MYANTVVPFGSGFGQAADSETLAGGPNHNNTSNAGIDFDQSPALWPALPRISVRLRRCGLTATLTSELCICWRDELTEFGLEQTMLGL